jgi:RNA polymerase-binding transcription factor
MDRIRQRLESDLDRTMDRIRHSSGTAMVEEPGGQPGEGGFLADNGDVICGNAEREMCFATRSLLVERAMKLSQALERLRDGQYGICEECGELIAPARLQAMPEVTTCVRCQDRRERAHRFERVTVGVGRPEDREED